MDKWWIHCGDSLDVNYDYNKDSKWKFRPNGLWMAQGCKWLNLTNEEYKEFNTQGMIFTKIDIDKETVFKVKNYKSALELAKTYPEIGCGNWKRFKENYSGIEIKNLDNILNKIGEEQCDGILIYDMLSKCEIDSLCCWNNDIMKFKELSNKEKSKYIEYFSKSINI